MPMKKLKADFFWQLSLPVEVFRDGDGGRATHRIPVGLAVQMT